MSGRKTFGEPRVYSQIIFRECIGCGLKKRYSYPVGTYQDELLDNHMKIFYVICRNCVEKKLGEYS